VSGGLLVLVLAGGAFAWVQTREGGARAQLERAIDSARDAVQGATTDPGLKRAATYFNAQYARDGRYTNLTEAQQREDPDADWGVGVTVTTCGPHALVLQSLTGAGTVSRLLARGVDHGDVVGDHPCPADLAAPAPWKVPGAS
jgi:hypothetical protein